MGRQTAEGILESTPSRGLCLHQLFSQQARRFPRRIAVKHEDGELTYAHLDAQSERLALRLRHLGVGPGMIVGLCVDRSFELVVGLLGILKAGGAYLPIDPSYPDRRIRFLLQDSGAALVVTTGRNAGRVDGSSARRVEIGAGPDPEALPAAAPADPGDLAYVIHTSGSTGTSKGVLVEHRSVVALFEATASRFHFDQHDVWSLFHSASFDFSVWEIWGALLHGGQLVLVSEDVARSPQRFLSLLEDSGVTVLNQTPSAFQLLASEIRRRGWPALALRQVIFGGEALDLALLEPWIERWGDQSPALVNMYGITETTVHVTYRRIRKEDLDRGGPSPIGRPLPHLQVYLVDEDGKVIEDGRPGEMYIAGPGLARGYLNQPQLTQRRFLDGGLPGLDEARLYRSGDRARRTGDGQLLYLGRLDDQIQIRGFRVEPAEIEICLAAHPGVVQAVVIPQDFGEGDVRLVAYLLPEPGAAALLDAEISQMIDELSDAASQELPAHLLPSEYRVISQLPLTLQGKVDRAALGQLREYRGRAPEEPTRLTETERAVSEIVEEILQMPGIPVDGDLFDLGATSLAIVRILRRTNETFGVHLNGSELVDEASIARLAFCVDSEVGSQALLSSGERA